MKIYRTYLNKTIDMKAKNIVWALVVALMSTVAIAQEGESTMEGIPVVEEIVSDSSMTSASGTQSQSITQVGSWSVSYTSDTIDTAEAIELLEEIFDEELPEGFEGLLKTMMGAATGGLIIVFIVLFGIFILPIILIIVILYFIYKGRKAKYDAYKSIAESGQAVPEEELRRMSEPITDRAMFNKGIKNIFLGIGLAVLLGIILRDLGIGIGILVACIGIGELLIDYFAKRNK